MWVTRAQIVGDNRENRTRREHHLTGEREETLRIQKRVLDVVGYLEKVT